MEGRDIQVHVSLEFLNDPPKKKWKRKKRQAGEEEELGPLPPLYMYMLEYYTCRYEKNSSSIKDYWIFMAAFGFYTRCVHGVEKQNKYLNHDNSFKSLILSDLF